MKSSSFLAMVLVAAVGLGACNDPDVGVGLVGDDDVSGDNGAGDDDAATGDDDDARSDDDDVVDDPVGDDDAIEDPTGDDDARASCTAPRLRSPRR